MQSADGSLQPKLVEHIDLYQLSQIPTWRVFGKTVHETLDYVHVSSSDLHGQDMTMQSLGWLLMISEVLGLDTSGCDRSDSLLSPRAPRISEASVRSNHIHQAGTTFCPTRTKAKCIPIA